MTGVDNLRIFWLFSTMILAPLALMVTYYFRPVIFCFQASFLATSISFEDSFIAPGSRMVGNILQSLCNVWIVGAFLFAFG